MKKRLSSLIITTLALTFISCFNIYANTKIEEITTINAEIQSIKLAPKVTGKVTSVNGNTVTLQIASSSTYSKEEAMEFNGEEITITLSDEDIISYGIGKSFGKGFESLENSDLELAERPVRPENSDLELAERPVRPENSDLELVERPVRPENSDLELAERPERPENSDLELAERPERPSLELKAENLSQETLSVSDIKVGDIIDITYEEDGKTIKEIKVQIEQEYKFTPAELVEQEEITF